MSDEKQELSTYFVIFKQASEGCDHTIACGTRVEQVTGINAKDALFQAFMNIGWERDVDHWTNESRMSSVKVVKAAAVDINVFEDHREDLRKLAEAKEATLEELAARKQYEELKERFG